MSKCEGEKTFQLLPLSAGKLNFDMQKAFEFIEVEVSQRVWPMKLWILCKMPESYASEQCWRKEILQFFIPLCFSLFFIWKYFFFAYSEYTCVEKTRHLNVSRQTWQNFFTKSFLTTFPSDKTRPNSEFLFFNSLVRKSTYPMAHVPSVLWLYPDRQVLSTRRSH